MASSSPSLRIDPPFWWTGMRCSELQLLVYAPQIALAQVEIKHDAVRMVNTHRVANSDYLFIDLEVAENAISGDFKIFFRFEQRPALEYTYELRRRDHSPDRHQGVTSKDLIYLLMPDRFANGDLQNDRIDGMQDMSLDRNAIYARHGGDIQGIIDHLDYLADLGVTAIWSTPEIENDQPEASYHGYAVTDHYQIDPRLGTNELYVAYVKRCHQMGLKVIKDLVHNHVGSRHWFILNLPSPDWINQWPEFTRTTHREGTVMDPYAAQVDVKLMQEGWFDYHMPDLNHRNPFVQHYLIQNHMWWIELAGINGVRLDTYPYNDPQFMATWAQRIKLEYPDLSIFGETVVSTVPSQAFFTQGNTVNRGFNTHLPGVTDIMMRSAIFEALNGSEGWNDGINRLYITLSLDFLYEDATRNVIFLDNHDVSRFFSMVGEDMSKFKCGIVLLLTLRGIPQLYYGTEILMRNFAEPDGMVRSDFPGGWPGDNVNKFLASHRTDQENEAFNFIKTLANYRKTHEVLQTGKLMQFVPVDHIYVYFRYNSTAAVMVIINNSIKDAELDTTRFKERISDFKKFHDIIHNRVSDISETLLIAAKTTLVYELLH